MKLTQLDDTDTVSFGFMEHVYVTLSSQLSELLLLGDCLVLVLRESFIFI